jgi:hypothetical protein
VIGAVAAGCVRICAGSALTCAETPALDSALVVSIAPLLINSRLLIGIVMPPL